MSLCWRPTIPADAIALFLALIDRCAVPVPPTSSVGAKKADYTALAQAEIILRLDAGGHAAERLSRRAGIHPRNPDSCCMDRRTMSWQ
jgi:hypothetical protein